MKDLTLAFTIIIKGCIANKMTPEQMASQLNEHVQHEANTNSLLQKIEADLGDTKRLFLLWHDGGEWILSLDYDSKQSKTLAELINNPVNNFLSEK